MIRSAVTESREAVHNDGLKELNGLRSMGGTNAITSDAHAVSSDDEQVYVSAHRRQTCSPGSNRSDIPIRPAGCHCAP